MLEFTRSETATGNGWRTCGLQRKQLVGISSCCCCKAYQIYFIGLVSIVCFSALSLFQAGLQRQSSYIDIPVPKIFLLKDKGSEHLLLLPPPVESQGHVVQPRPARTPNYGGLVFHSLSTQNCTRRIFEGDDIKYNKERIQEFQMISRSITYEDVSRSLPGRYDHYFEVNYPSGNGCYRPLWSFATYPSCNSFHELDIGRKMEMDQNFEISYLGRGHFRHAWAVIDAHGIYESVIKTNRLWNQREFKEYAFSQAHAEALSMLQTSSSNRTMDIYGYCGTSTRVEPGEPIEKLASPSFSWAVEQQKLDELQAEDLPQNDYSPEQKLEVALAMAEGLAELHGNREGVIINHDMSLGQWLVSKKDGLLKLNDFNKARIPYWNPTIQSYCPVWSNQPSSHRAPEEIQGGYVDESADVVALGKIFYILLTGLRPYYSMDGNEQARAAVVAGELPFVDPRYRTRSLIEGRLVEIMEQCWQFKPRDRPSIFTVVAHLRETGRLASAEVQHDVYYLLYSDY